MAPSIPSNDLTVDMGFERFYDEATCLAFREQMKERVRQFQMKIQEQGYAVRAQFTRQPHMDIYQIDIVEAKMAYGFFVTGVNISVHEYHQVV